MRSCAHKVHSTLGETEGQIGGQNDGRKDGKPQTMSLRFSSKRHKKSYVNLGIFRLVFGRSYGCAMHKWADQLLPQLLMEQFDTFFRIQAHWKFA